MPINARPEFFKAEAKYKAARTPEEQLAALREMLAVAPKHKSAEKLLKDIKTRISKLRKAEPARKGRRHDPFSIAHQGGGQVVLVGAPNVGKSSIVAALTDAPAKVSDYPFSTQVPVPGMARHEDVALQLVDTPPITSDHVEPGMNGAVRGADALLLVVSLASNRALEDLDTTLNYLDRRGLRPVFDPEPDWAGGQDKWPVKCLAACTHADQPQAAETLQTLRDLYGHGLRMVPVSATTGEGLREMMRLLFELLDLIRAYAKPPGHPPDMAQPFVLPRGSTVLDLADAIHHDKAARLKGARIWGTGVHAGQRVHGEHVLHDKDVVELHT